MRRQAGLGRLPVQSHTASQKSVLLDSGARAPFPTDANGMGHPSTSQGLSGHEKDGGHGPRPSSHPNPFSPCLVPTPTPPRLGPLPWETSWRTPGRPSPRFHCPPPSCFSLPSAHCSGLQRHRPMLSGSHIRTRPAGPRGGRGPGACSSPGRGNKPEVLISRFWTFQMCWLEVQK